MHPNRLTPGPRLVERELSHLIVGSFYHAYNGLGYGFVEPIYTNALVVALQLRGLSVEREVPIVVVFEGVEVGHHRADLIVEGRVIIEVKSTERVSNVHKRQLRNYLTALKLELGLLLHFGPTAEVHRVLGPWRPSQPRSDSDNSD